MIEACYDQNTEVGMDKDGHPEEPHNATGRFRSGTMKRTDMYCETGKNCKSLEDDILQEVSNEVEHANQMHAPENWQNEQRAAVRRKVLDSYRVLTAPTVAETRRLLGEVRPRRK
jgi:hypothetical protein